MPRTTIADVARAAGVSKGAASHALNGKPGVSDATRARVLLRAEELGWRPDFAARALSSSSRGSYGLAVARTPDTIGTESFFMSLLAGIEEGLSARDTALVIQLVPDVAAECRVLERWAGERRVHGALLIDPRVDDLRIATVERLGIPAAVMAPVPLSDSIATLVCDEDARMDIALTHLVDRGHRRIAYLAGDAPFLHVVHRRHRFELACSELQVSGEVEHGDYSAARARDSSRHLAAHDPGRRPTAVIADNDLLAALILGELASLGIRVPEDMAVLALEDSLLCGVTRPRLTAVARDVVAHGREMVELLGTVVSGSIRDVTAPPSTLRIRESTAAPPGRPGVIPS